MTPRPREPRATAAAAVSGSLPAAPDSATPYGAPRARPATRRAGRPRGGDTVALGLRVPRAVYDHLGTVAEHTGITKQRLVTDALRDYLPRFDDGYPAAGDARA